MELSKITSTAVIEPVLLKTAKVKHWGNSHHIIITKEEMDEFLEENKSYGIMIFNYVKNGEGNDRK